MFQYTAIVGKQCKWLTFDGMFSKTVKKKEKKETVISYIKKMFI